MSLRQPASAAAAAAAASTAGAASAKRKSCSGSSRSVPSSKQRPMRLVNGHPESAVLDMRLTDILAPNLRVLIVGINPGVFSAASGHHYGNSANHFWPCLSASGLVPRAVTYHDDAACLQWGIGFTNMVPRCSRSEADLTKCVWGRKD